VLEPRRLQQQEPTRWLHHSRDPAAPSDSRHACSAIPAFRGTASWLQVANFSRRARSFGTPHDEHPTGSRRVSAHEHVRARRSDCALPTSSRCFRGACAPFLARSYTTPWAERTPRGSRGGATVGARRSPTACARRSRLRSHSALGHAQLGGDRCRGSHADGQPQHDERRDPDLARPASARGRRSAAAVRERYRRSRTVS
jgi:hypothetical protein